MQKTFRMITLEMTHVLLNNFDVGKDIVWKVGGDGSGPVPCIFFVQRPDALGRHGLSTLQKCTATVRMLTYGVSADGIDEYCRLGETAVTVVFHIFVMLSLPLFAPTYMRRVNENDISMLLQINDVRGFPGMRGSIDYMH